MFDLDKAVMSWRANMAGSDSIDHDGLLELETHLRDEIDDRVANGMTSEEAFEEARLKLGQRQELNVEYAKVHPNVSWKRRLLAMLVGYMSLSILVNATHLVYTLLERLLWRAGADSVLFTFPWSIRINRYDYIGAAAPEGLDSWNQVSLATLITTGVWAILVFGLVWVVYRFVNGRSLKLNKLVSFCQSTQPRVIMATLLLGVLYSQIVYGRSWYVRLLHFLHGDLKMSDNGLWIQRFGSSVILPVTFWITPLALSLVGWIGFHAYRRDRLRGVYNVQALAVCGFVTAFFLLRAAAIMDWAVLTGLRLFGIEGEPSLTPIRITYAQFVNASLLVLILSVALSGWGLPTLGRFLKRLPLRPSLVIVSWVFLQWILIPFQVFFTVSGSGWDQWLLDEDLTSLLMSCFSPYWVPAFFVFSYGQVYAAILTLVAVMLAWRARMTSKPSPETKHWA